MNWRNTATSIVNLQTILSLPSITTINNLIAGSCASATTASFVKVPDLISHQHHKATMSAPSCSALNNKRSCIPCECLDKSHILPVETILSELQTLPLWKIRQDETDEDKDNNVSKVTKLSKKYVAKNFNKALESINAIGQIAERENHHPDIHLTGYRNVEIVLYTHSIGGVSVNDLRLAKMIEEEVGCVREFYSPKWLRENGLSEDGSSS